MSFYTAKCQDTINWRSSYKLKWEDFKGKPDTTSDLAAITASTITWKIFPKGSTFIIKVYCYFTRSWSWMLFKNAQILLKHEQGHFDIAELCARKFRLALKTARLQNSNEIYTIYAKIQAEKKKLNSLYDEETDFSNNVEKQLYWSKKILSEINKLNTYKE